MPGAAVAVVALAVLSVSFGTTASADTDAGNGGSAPASTTAPAGTAAPADTATPTGQASDGSAGDAQGTPSAPAPAAPEKVRDAFAGLQATLNETCDAECPYFLGRVYDELRGSDQAMKADPKGPGHFPEPIGLIEKLNGELDGDRSFENQKKHQSLLVGTRDKNDAWMQGHPDDYR